MSGNKTNLTCFCVLQLDNTRIVVANKAANLKCFFIIFLFLFNSVEGMLYYCYLNRTYLRDLILVSNRTIFLYITTSAPYFNRRPFLRLGRPEFIIRL